MISRRHRIIGISALAAVAVIVTTLLVVLRPLSVEIPAEYQGWGVIRYGDPQCAPAHVSGVFRVVAVSEFGSGCTSSYLNLDLPTYYKFQYVYPDGHRKTLRWGASGGEVNSQVWLFGNTAGDKRMGFFVGDKHEMENSGAPPR
jgi:hypothetical protein